MFLWFDRPVSLGIRYHMMSGGGSEQRSSTGCTLGDGGHARSRTRKWNWSCGPCIMVNRISSKKEKETWLSCVPFSKYVCVCVCDTDSSVRTFAWIFSPACSRHEISIPWDCANVQWRHVKGGLAIGAPKGHLPGRDDLPHRSDEPYVPHCSWIRAVSLQSASPHRPDNFKFQHMHVASAVE